KMLEAVESSGIASVVALQNWDQIRKAKERRSAVRFLVSLGEERNFTVYSFEQLTKAAKEANLPLHVHIAEMQEDVQIVRENFQRDSITLLNSFNALRQNTVLAHANYATEDEVKLIKSTGATVVVCPRSTAAKQTGYPSIRYLAKHNVRLALGADWGAIDMIDEMRFLYRLPFVVPGLRMFTATEILRMATINGATAFGLGTELGSIERGKRAHLTLLNAADVRLPHLHLTSSNEDWARLLIENLTTADISDVMLDGVWKMRERKFVESSAKQIMDEFCAVHEKFFPPAALARTGQQHAQKEANVLPFTSDRSSTSQEAGGFESGVAAGPKSTPIIDITEAATESSPPEHPRPPQREPLKPELPKNARRVFGEDEDL
ncbi:MAG: amidohydrolase family protein, partial [Ignavibacteriae bacterium]|nr:amidohydrolase family protein [Ignavibacteriota bacterium]